MPQLTIATRPIEAGLKVHFSQRGGDDDEHLSWTLERNQWGLMASVEAAECLLVVTRRVSSACIYPYVLRERLQESVYGGRAVEIEVDTDVRPVAAVRIDGRAVR